MSPFNRLKSLLAGKQKTQSVIGFRHAHGIGIRSKYYVMPLSRGASGFTRALAEDAHMTLIENKAESSDPTSMAAVTQIFLPKLAQHRHTAGILLIAVGDEPTPAQEIAAQIQALGTPCEYLVITDFPDMEMATNLALGTAQELKTMALSGIDRIEESDLTIVYQEEPACLTELVALLEKNKFALRVHQMSPTDKGEMSALAMEGSHAILSFEAADQYPSGTLVTPVINVASDSNFHRAISTEFDLIHDSSVAEILQKVQEVFGMVPTISEALGTHEPLFESNVPSLNDVADADEICLIPANPVLISFLIDLVSNKTGFFLKDWESFNGQDVAAKKILVIGTGGAGDENHVTSVSDSRVTKLNVSEFGSFHALATAILAEA
jgi:altronate dehydratase